MRGCYATLSVTARRVAEALDGRGGEFSEFLIGNFWDALVAVSANATQVIVISVTMIALLVIFTIACAGASWRGRHSSPST